MLLTAFDVMDDTVAVKKTFFPDIVADIDTIAADRHGKKVDSIPAICDLKRRLQVLLYLLAPRSPKYFHPDVVALLAQSNNNPNRHVHHNSMWVERDGVQQEGSRCALRRAAAGHCRRPPKGLTLALLCYHRS